MEYKPAEMMAISAARMIENRDIVFCGTGISMLAAMAAKHISAPESVIFFETGAIDSQLEEIPLAVGDSRVMLGTAVNGSLLDAFATMQNRLTGLSVVGILGAAQIDKFGNLNSTVIGDYEKPTVRFSGSGGAADVASFVSRSIIFMQHQKRKFVRKVDYITSPGWLTGGNSRQKSGLCRGGPWLVITNMAIMGFDDETREMYLKEYFPGVHPETILQNMAFEVDITRATEAIAPSERELQVLREVCDPQKLILRR
ncbi:MAG: CoA-transferase [Pseudomonadota bacterium]